MKARFSGSQIRGGAPVTIAPEIALAPKNKAAELDYTKADIWSLGVVLARMCTTTTMDESQYGVVDGKKQLNAATLAHLPATSPVLDLISRIVTLSPTDRWSCDMVHARASSLLASASTASSPASSS